MKILFHIGVLLALGFVAVCAYWYTNPRHAPSFMRWNAPTFQLPRPNSPMQNFRPPDF